MDEQDNTVDKSIPLSRRYFLELLGLGSIGVVTVGSMALSASYLSPNVVKEPPTRFRIGPPDSFLPGSVTLIEEQHVFVVRAAEGFFFALSATCTHLGCIANWKRDEGIIACPCHGSKFSKEGIVIGGPAPRPLPRYEMTLDEEGILVVNKGTIVDESRILTV